MSAAAPSPTRTVITPKLSNRFVIWNKKAEQPHHLDIAACFTLQPTARLHRVEIPVDIEFQKNGRVMGGPTRGLWIDAGKAKLAKIKCIDKGIDDTNRIVIVSLPSPLSLGH
jgi:hypothetical protein